MFGRKKLQQQLDDRNRKIQDLADKLDEAIRERDAALAVNRQLRWELAEAKAAAKRTHEHNEVLVELLETAREANGEEEYGRLELRHERALRACARYRAELAEQARHADWLSTRLLTARHTDDELRLLGIEPLAPNLQAPKEVAQ
ncbi:MAG TPA: hypothetical protein VFY14_10895 [Streptomyces sp.]|nr:hypothetical protein [Streptomyces sp.]